ncbi:MAG: hypothetical protein Q9195_007569 [Heterodermia aff. obscurata]
MGKSKKTNKDKHIQKPYSRPSHHRSNKKGSLKSAPTLQVTVTIPFESSNSILLVGEGDFSFSHSLLTAHGCTSLLATSYESRSSLVEKYPQAATFIADLEAEETVEVLYRVDATKLDKAGKKITNGGFDRIVFNFPHVGGLTKDVNRQVRYNQELLVGFFRSALPLLAPAGSIVVTIFDGEPYELWNIRDLARHVGLKVDRSFKFQASAYPGYRHARTLGNIRDGGGWKGEERGARTYIFDAKNGVASHPQQKNSNESTDDDDD